MKKEMCLFFMTLLMWLIVIIEGKFLLLTIKEDIGFRKLREVKGKFIFFRQIIFCLNFNQNDVQRISLLWKVLKSIINIKFQILAGRLGITFHQIYSRNLLMQRPSPGLVPHSSRFLLKCTSQ